MRDGVTTGSRPSAGGSRRRKPRGSSGSCAWPKRDCPPVRDRAFAEWLVRWYPPSFREAVGGDLADAIDDRIRAQRAAGASRARIVWLGLADTLRNAPGAWTRAALDTAGAIAAPARHPSSGERTMLDRLRQDVRYAVRTWLRRPGVAVVALATLAIGVGANTAIFSLVNAVLLRPLPFPNADRVVAIWGRTAAAPQAL